MDICEFNGCRLYTGLTLDYTLGLWAPTSASRAISAAAELLVLTTEASHFRFQKTRPKCFIGAFDERPPWLGE